MLTTTAERRQLALARSIQHVRIVTCELGSAPGPDHAIGRVFSDAMRLLDELQAIAVGPFECSCRECRAADTAAGRHDWASQTDAGHVLPRSR